MVIKPVHAEAIVEEGCRPARPIGDEPVKPSVQSGRKGGVFLVEMDEIARPLRLDGMASPLQSSGRAWFEMVLSRKDQDGIPLFAR